MQGLNSEDFSAGKRKKAERLGFTFLKEVSNTLDMFNLKVEDFGGR